MIDWFNVFANFLWILALSIALSVLSWASWDASNRGIKMRSLLSTPNYELGLNIAGALFCAGLALTTPEPWWETTLWTLLGVSFLAQIGYGLYQRRNPSALAEDAPMPEAEKDPAPDEIEVATAEEPPA